MTLSPATDTKEQLLNVAEKMFAERGFAGTSLRGVVNDAGANLAAVHYHFGSKEALFKAVVARIAKPVVAQQLEQLAQLEAKATTPAVEDILRAFLGPPLACITENNELRLTRAQFMGRCRTEPEPLQALAVHEFEASHINFLNALQRSLPDQSRAQLGWKLDLVISILIRVMIQAGKPQSLLQGSQPAEVEATLEKLIHFIAPGLQA